MTDAAHDFFQNVFENGRELIGRLPITLEPPTIAYVEQVLERAVDQERSRSPFCNPDHAAAEDLRRPGESAVGLNTIGMLLDRLSILTLKHWNLLHRKKDPAKAQELLDTQISEIVRALAASRRGFSSINNKLSNRRVDADLTDFSAACFGLFTVNALLWEAQEVLYNRDIGSLPCEELRSYIGFFSRGNLARNAYIEAADGLYWTAVAPGGQTAAAR
jgi:hypothetical protein